MLENQSIQCTIIYSEPNRALSMIQKNKRKSNYHNQPNEQNKFKMLFSQLITENLSYECLRIILILYLDISEKKFPVLFGYIQHII